MMNLGNPYSLKLAAKKRIISNGSFYSRKFVSPKELELYEDDLAADTKMFSDSGCSCNNRPNYGEYLGKKLGFVPYVGELRDLINPEDVKSEPVYLNSRNLLSKYFDSVEKDTKWHFAEEFGVLPFSEGLQIGVAELPTNYIVENNEVVGIQKVFGLYDPSRKRILLDPVLFKELNHPERARLLRYMGELPTAERVLTEEFIHSVQDDLGIIYHHYTKYGPETSRRKIEGAAARESERILGRRDRIYEAEKRQYEDEVQRKGRRAAFLEGSIPEVMGMPLYGYN